MNVERQKVLKIPANQGSVCLFVPITLYKTEKMAIISMILVIETLNLVFRGICANSISGIRIFLYLTVYELLVLPHSLLPTSLHKTAVSIIRLQYGISTIYYPK